MKMSVLFKRSIAVFVCSLILAVSFSVSACAPSNKADKIMLNANAKISAYVEKAQNEADRLVDKGCSSDSKRILTICSDLQEDTQKIEVQAEKRLDDMGATYTCETYYVDIAGNQVLIDPFKSF